jgi:polyhydroxyalkanoate synthesis regulator phasin
MRSKVMFDLLSLSVGIALLAKDEEFIEELSGLAAAGKEKAGELYDEFTGDEHGELFSGVLAQASVLRDDLKNKMEQTAKTVYSALHIAHTDEIAKLSGEIEALKAALARTEATLNEIQQKNG